MRNEGKQAEGNPFSLAGVLFDILLLLVNCVGIVGALTEILEIPWEEVPKGQAGTMAVQDGVNGIVFWGGVFLFCVAVVFLRGVPIGKKAIFCSVICVISYLLVGIICKNALTVGISTLFQNAVQSLNENYGFHIAWTVSWMDASIRTLVITGTALYILFPPVLLAGVLGLYDKGFCLILGNALWFTAACACDRFPGFFNLSFCVLGVVATLVQKEFCSRPGKGFGVVACAVSLAGLCMAAVFFFLLPVLDWQYEEIVERRAQFYALVNEEWLPRIKQMLPGEGFGSGVDVTGELGRDQLFAYTADDAYRVTVDRKPQGAIYLKGFVGDTYGEREWLAGTDEELEDYYQSKGMELPDSYNKLFNLSYEAARELQGGEEPAHIRIEELGGRGSYSIYPYGALLDDGYRVHGDGSAARKSSDYTFQYYPLSGFGRQGVLQEDRRETEQYYRQFVYDSYLEYPREKLPRLTKFLETAKIRTDNVYVCVLDLMYLLDSQADYNLDAENNPAGTDFVEYFLLDSHEGYCMHFASTAVLALRYFGIPARYVAGYTVSPSDFEHGGGEYTAVLTGRQAHAWAEVYLDTIGWVPVEMTPSAVAFPEDNRMEQAGALGQLAGQGLMLSENEELWNPDKMAWQSMNSEYGLQSTEGQELGTGGLSETTGMSGLEDAAASEGIKESGSTTEPDPTVEDGTSGNETERDSQRDEEDSETKTPVTERLGFRIFMRVLAVCLLLAALVCLEKWDENRRRDNFRKAEIREQIYLLYKSFRRVFQTVGIRRNLDIDGEEFRLLFRNFFQVEEGDYEGFCHILEKNTFAEEAPSEIEFQELLALYKRLTEQVYLRVSFYKKPLIRRYLNCI